MLKHEGPYNCDLCGMILKNRETMYHHMIYRHLKAPDMFCDHCPKSFNKKGQIPKHMKSHMKFHTFICDVCEYKTNFKESLKTHKLIHKKKTECPICHRAVAAMIVHMRAMHKMITCKICDKKMGRVSFYGHIRKVHGKTMKNAKKLFGQNGS